jgi:hypothetical protein
VDAFEAKLAGVLKHECAVLFDVFIELKQISSDLNRGDSLSGLAERVYRH